MHKTFERPRSRSAGLAAGVASLAVMVELVAVVSHLAGLLETRAFIWVMVVATVLALLAMMLVFAGFTALWRYAAIGGRKSAKGFVLALIALVPAMAVSAAWLHFPQLIQVSTSVSDPPGYGTLRLARPPGSNPLTGMTSADAQLQMDSYPEVSTKRHATPPGIIAETIETMLAERNWQVMARLGAAEAGNQMTFHALARLPVIALPSDVAIRIVASEDTSLVDMRSSSRFGPHDLGANAWIVNSFLGELNERLIALGAE